MGHPVVHVEPTVNKLITIIVIKFTPNLMHSFSLKYIKVLQSHFN